MKNLPAVNNPAPRSTTNPLSKTLQNKAGMSKLFREGLGKAASLQAMGLGKQSAFAKLAADLEKTANLQAMGLAKQSAFAKLAADLQKTANLQAMGLGQQSAFAKLAADLQKTANLQAMGLAKQSTFAKLAADLQKTANLQAMGLAKQSAFAKLAADLQKTANLQAMGLGKQSAFAKLAAGLGKTTNLQAMGLGRQSAVAKLATDLERTASLQAMGSGKQSAFAKLAADLQNIPNFNGIGPKKLDQKGRSIHLKSSGILSVIKDLQNTPLTESENTAFLASLEATETGDLPLGNLIQLQDVDLRDLGKEKDFNKLPTAVQNIVLNVIYGIIGNLISFLILSEFSKQKEESILNIEINLCNCDTVKDVKKTAKSSSDLGITPSLLRGYRVTTRNHLQLRSSRNRSAPILAMLPLGTIVEVIHDSKRSWLLVRVKCNDQEETGWVHRRYTAPFR